MLTAKVVDVFVITVVGVTEPTAICCARIYVPEVAVPMPPSEFVALTATNNVSSI